jgi:ornithine cyclodeaminase
MAATTVRRIPTPRARAKEHASMLVLNARQVRQALPMADAIAAMRVAFSALSGGRAVMPERVHLALPGRAGTSLFMPAFVDDSNPAARALCVKAVSVFDGNPARGLARIQAAVVLLEPDTGRPVALLEGATLTAIRTAAGTGVATDLLARPDARRLALFGAGVQARTHLEAMCAVRPIEEVAIFGRTPARAEAMIAELIGQPWLKARLRRAPSPRDALDGADVVCAATTSAVPVFEDADVPAGAHINAVGAYMPSAREVPPETVRRAYVVVDSRHAAWAEAGDLIQPLRAGVIDRDHIRAELGELLLGRASGRADTARITLFKSVGIAVQDAVAARVAWDNARRLGLGTEVEW